MTSRPAFSLLVAGALLVTGLFSSDASAQNRSASNRPKPTATPVVKQFPQVMPPSIQMTVNNMYMNEWSKRAALNQMLMPKFYIQPYPVNPWYQNGYYPNSGVPFGR